MASRSRIEGNRWLRPRCARITGRVLSVGSRSDKDKEDGRYRNYFTAASEYQTSDMRGDGADVKLDIRAMPEVPDATYDAVFCWSVLEHVDEVHAAVRECARILKPGGVFIVGVPFGYRIHMAPQDFWRFTEHGIRVLLRPGFDVVEIAGFDGPPGFPAYYGALAHRVGGA